MWSEQLLPIKSWNLCAVFMPIIFLRNIGDLFRSLLVSPAMSSQTIELNFFWYFSINLTNSAAFRALFDALNSTVSVCSDAVCGQTCGQRALLDQARHPLPPPVQKGSFSCLSLGYCTSSGEEKQEVFSSQTYQFLTRLYKEYSLAGGGPNSPA